MCAQLGWSLNPSVTAGGAGGDARVGPMGSEETTLSSGDDTLPPQAGDTVRLAAKAGARHEVSSRIPTDTAQAKRPREAGCAGASGMRESAVRSGEPLGAVPRGRCVPGRGGGREDSAQVRKCRREHLSAISIRGALSQYTCPYVLATLPPNTSAPVFGIITAGGERTHGNP